MPIISRMKATLGSVMTDRSRISQPGSSRSIVRPFVANCRISPPASSTVRPSNSFLGPIGVAPAQLGEAADQRNRVVRRLRRHGILQRRLLRIALFVLAVLVRGAAWQA